MDKIREYLIRHNCPDIYLDKLTELFEKYSNGIPQYFGYTDQSGKESNGFYVEFLRLSKTETDPIGFFEILKIDEKIGWINYEHLEETIFGYKAIKVIKDKKVNFNIFSNKNKN